MKEDQRTVLTKRLLKEGLLKLLKSEDIGKISVTELCSVSGINRATFYRHYQQPRDIIADIRRDVFNNVKEIADIKIAESEPIKWLENMCRCLYAQADLLKIMFSCRTDGEFVLFINELCIEHIKEIRYAGYGDELDDNELKLTTYCFAGGVYYVLRQWIMEPIEKSPEEIAKILYRLLPFDPQANDK